MLKAIPKVLISQRSNATTELLLHYVSLKHVNEEHEPHTGNISTADKVQQSIRSKIQK